MNFSQWLCEMAKLKLDVGTAGRLRRDQLLNPFEVFADSFKKLDTLLATGQKIDIAKEFAGDPAYNVWLNYVKSMFGEIRYRPNGSIDRRGFHKNDTAKQYPKQARGFIGWLQQIRSGKLDRPIVGGKYPILAFKDNDEYIFGHWVHGFFIACYISTSGPFGLLKLLKKLCAYDNIVFQVTLDMADQLKQVGLFTDGKVHTAKYAGHEVQKMVFATSEHALELALLFDEVLKAFYVGNDLNNNSNAGSID